MGYKNLAYLLYLITDYFSSSFSLNVKIRLATPYCSKINTILNLFQTTFQTQNKQTMFIQRQV